MSRSEVATLKRNFIQDREVILKRKLTALENKLFDSVFNKLVTELEQNKGKIVSNNKNIDLTAALDKVFKSFNENEYYPVVVGFGKDLVQLQDFNKKYFETIEADQVKLEKISKDVNSVMKKRIGLNAKDEIVKNGYLDRLIKDDALKTKIKNETYKAVTSGVSISEYQEKIKKIIVGNEKVNGALTKHFEQFAFDTYAQFNRATSKLYAVKLGLSAFIYQGGEIKTSRCFCVKNDGKVFTTEEAEKWKDLVNTECGPVVEEGGTYEPVVDLGGINCRHSADYISDSLAVRMRPDLQGVFD